MRSRAMFVAVVLTSALVSGGWLVERGLVGSTSTPTDGVRLFDQVFDHISREYVDTLADSALYTRAIDGLVSELHDPHSSYLSPQLLARLSESTTGRYAGVGAQIDVRDGWITIVAPLPGGPAIDAGIATGDRIVEVNGKPMHGLTVEEAQKALRGAPGTTVRVSIERPGGEAHLQFSLVRREIHVHSVQHAMLLRDGVGYVALTIFSEESAPELQHAIDSLRSAGMTSLIFDLRRNPGGLLDQGVGVAELFLDPRQRIVSMAGRTAGSSRVFDDREPQPWPKLPLAVLVDSNSASASEIVAGALQDHDRAVLLGTTTYGKGSAQNVFPLGNAGAVKLTTALWFTPSGRSINRKRADDGGDGPPVDTSLAKRPRYRTDGGRTVLGGGGITPDVLLSTPGIPSSDTAFVRALGAHVPEFSDAVTDYALSLKGSHAIPSQDFVVTPAMRAELLKRMEARHIHMDAVIYEAAAPLVSRRLGYEIARYVFGEPAEFARRLRDDTAIASALRLVAGAPTQKALLDRAVAVPRVDSALIRP